MMEAVHRYEGTVNQVMGDGIRKPPPPFHMSTGAGPSTTPCAIVRVEAEGCLRRAIELAHRRDEKSFELRASTSLARLLDGQGKRDEARALLDALA